MNENIIFFIYSPVVIQYTNSSVFFIGQSTYKTPLLIRCLCYYITFDMLHVFKSYNWNEFFNLGNKRKLHRARYGEYRKYCTCPI